MTPEILEQTVQYAATLKVERLRIRLAAPSEPKPR
jgi:hypothetical protein